MYVVEVTFTNLSADVNNDAHGEDLTSLAETALESCRTAAEVLEEHHTKRSGCFSSFRVCGREDRSSLPADAIGDRLVKDIHRYVKVRDRYMVLTSILFKSQAFHQTHAVGTTDPLPAVELPRTDRGKPFIPATAAAAGHAEWNVYPVSISHQFPFAGMARFMNDETGANDKDVYLGMDIVVFDPYNTTLYDSVEDFVNVFRDSFTDWEWQKIMATNNNIMVEFYLRWSMKEAYTKALGLGLHLDFSAFETRLDVVDASSQDGIWSAVSSNKRGTHLCGSVVRGAEASSWDFFFLPLLDNEDSAGQQKLGCACMCVGPLPDTSDEVFPAFDTRIHWTTIHDLIQWHQER